MRLLPGFPPGLLGSVGLTALLLLSAGDIAQGETLVCTAPAGLATESPLLRMDPYPNFTSVCAKDVVPSMRQLIKGYNDSITKLEGVWAKEAKQGTASWESLYDQLDLAGAQLGYARGIVSHLLDVANSPELRAAHDVIEPEMMPVASRIGTSRPRYDALVSLKKNPTSWANLDAVQQRIVDVSIRDMEMTGVQLDAKKRKEFDDVMLKLSMLSSKFADNVMDSTNVFSYTVKDKKRLEGLPERYYTLYAEDAVTRGHKTATAEAGPWVITLDGSSYEPALRYCKDRELRKELYQASNKVASTGKTDNGKVIMDILKYRQRMAAIVGYPNYAELSLHNTMAGRVSAVEELLSSLRAKSYEPAKKYVGEIKTYAKKHGFQGEMEPWDVPYWSGKRNEEIFGFRGDDLRPYLPMPAVLDGLWGLVNRLFGVTVVEADGEAEVWNTDVRFYHVVDDASGERLASFYLDPYSRPENKRGGAWTNTLVDRSKLLGTKPLAIITASGPRPSQSAPALLALSEARTLFHETGHALQAMLTTVDYDEASGSNAIEWDAVEFPSQFMENWVTHKATLYTFANHYKTGEPLPEAMYDKVMVMKNNGAGVNLLESLFQSELDMRLHSSFDPSNKKKEKHNSLWDLESKVAKDYSVLPEDPHDRSLCSFDHIFAGGYAAGYYSYTWALVMSADAFAAFEEVGLDNEAEVEEVGRRFRATVLSLGGGTPPEKVFEEFRGRPFTVDALLEQSGLVPDHPTATTATAKPEEDTTAAATTTATTTPGPGVRLLRSSSTSS